MAKRRQPRSWRVPSDVGDVAGSGPASGWRRWWNTATKAAVGIGAIGSAAAAGLSLWPGPDPANLAKINTVRVTTEVPLSEYRQRLTATHLPDAVGARPWGALAAGPPLAGQMRVTPPPVEDEPGDPDPGGGETGPADEGTGPAEGGETADPATQDPTGEPLTPPPPTEQPAETPPAAGNAAPIPPAPSSMADLPPAAGPAICASVADHTSGSACPTVVEKMWNAVSTDENGGRASPEEAAERLVNILKETRTTGAKEPLGVVVAVDVELVDMRDKSVFVSWSMWQVGGAKRLYGEWLNTNFAYRLRATSDHDSASLNFWIPLPQTAGPYFIRTTLVADGNTIASANSEHFR